MFGKIDNQHTAKRTAVTGGVIIVLLMLLTAGSVAAVILMQSQTDVNENTLDNRYITISSSDYTDILDTATFDTVNRAGVITYDLHEDSDIDNVAGNECAKISNTFTLTVAPTNVSGSYDLYVSVTEFSQATGITYLLKVGSTVAEYQNGSMGYGWYVSGLTLGASYDTDLYVAETSGPVTTDPGATLGFTNYVDANTPGSIFTFLAYIPDA